MAATTQVNGHSGIAKSASTVPATDPAVYSKHHEGFAKSGLPSDADAWIQRAAQVSAILAEDATVREKENKSPFAEVSLLKSAGLTKILGPTKYGGGGQGWDVAYKVIREVAKGDGSIGQLIGYHLLWSWTSAVVGTDEQNDRTQKLIIENNYFVGAAVNPRDNDQKIVDDGDHIVFSGFKHFSTGGVISDLTVLEGVNGLTLSLQRHGTNRQQVYEGSDAHIFALVPTNQPAVVFLHNWDNMGLRLTESGSVRIEDARVPWTDALGWDPETKAPLEKILTIPWATLLLPTSVPQTPIFPISKKNATANPFLFPQKHPTNLLKHVHRHRPRRPLLRLNLHPKNHPFLALRPETRLARRRRTIHPPALRLLPRPSPRRRGPRQRRGGKSRFDLR